MRLKILMALILLSLTTTAHAVSFDQNPDAMEQLKMARLQVDSGLFDHAKQQAIEVYMSRTASDTEKAYALYLLGLSMFRESGSKDPKNIPWDMLWIEFPGSPHAFAVRMLTTPSETEDKLNGLDRPGMKDFVLGEFDELKTQSIRNGRMLRNVYWTILIKEHPESAAADMARSIMPVYD